MGTPCLMDHPPGEETLELPALHFHLSLPHFQKSGFSVWREPGTTSHAEVSSVDRASPGPVSGLLWLLSLFYLLSGVNGHEDQCCQHTGASFSFHRTGAKAYSYTIQHPGSCSLEGSPCSFLLCIVEKKVTNYIVGFDLRR